MTSASVSILVRRVVQVLALIGIWWAADALVSWTGLPLPGGLVGLLVVLLLLLSGWLPLRHVELGAQWLLGEMLMFFIPAVVAVARYSELFKSVGWRLLVVIVVGNAAVMLVTAVVVEIVSRRHAGAGDAAPAGEAAP